MEPNDANRALYDAGFEHQMELLEAGTAAVAHPRRAGGDQGAEK